MIECKFESGAKARLRHAVAEAVLIKDGQIALVKRAKRLDEGGKWAIPGGYMNRDETIKEAVVREALEETGWKVKVGKLFRIKDDPIRLGEDNQNIAFVYLAEAVIEIQESDHETDELRWFALDNLPSENEIAFDHADDIKLYKKYLKENFKLPVVG